jgi:hypothetical protein
MKKNDLAETKPSEVMKMNRRTLMRYGLLGTVFVATGCGGFDGRPDPPNAPSIFSPPWRGEEELPSSWELVGDPSPSQYLTPQRMKVMPAQKDGMKGLRFSGKSAPLHFDFFANSYGKEVSLYDLYPSSKCPFGIDESLDVGPSHYALGIPDRAAEGIVPAVDELWALNMIPFGVTIEGTLIDPSGPWYDGGAPDPQNPFDRKCSGWEYDPIAPLVAELVGVVPEVRGHCQPGQSNQPGSDGLFHYHGYPYLMIANMKKAYGSIPSPLLIGYSGDGYPIYDCFVPGSCRENGKDLYLYSGYVLKSGTRKASSRTNPNLTPSGAYSGIYVQDFEHDPHQKRLQIEATIAQTGQYHKLTKLMLSSGSSEYALLDKRNGILSSSIGIKSSQGLKEYQGSVYFYVLTRDWPEVPRYFSTLPSESFRNIIPLVRGGRPARIQLYDNAPSGLECVHDWHGRGKY